MGFFSSDYVHDLQKRLLSRTMNRDVSQVSSGSLTSPCDCEAPRCERDGCQDHPTDTALRLADEFARSFLSFLEHEAPVEEWDGGEIGYSMGGLASMADDYQKARAALDAEGVSEPGQDSGNEEHRPERAAAVRDATDPGSLTFPDHAEARPAEAGQD